jgi:hypothetical protein
MNFKAISIFFLLLLLRVHFVKAQNTEELQVPILVVGGGASGVTAGLQASRLGVETLIIEETDWLGGMLTAAGVAAIDGNHQLPSGLWGEFRQKLYDYYGGANRVETGWVSNTLFEPVVGNKILKEMCANSPNLKILYHTTYTKVAKVANGWEVYAVNGAKKYIIHATILIDCTELGDIMAAAKADFFLGMDSRQRTGEIYAPEKSNDIVQDLTYVAILKDFGKGTDKTIAKPLGYNSALFEQSCSVANQAEKNNGLLACEKMITYGKLPNGKYMINWPNHGNDIYLNIVAKTPSERQKELEKAKNHTLSFVYYLQTALGFRNLGLSDEFGTKDNLPKMPYYRESRRLDGLVNLSVNYLEQPFGQEFPLYRTGGIVGDYNIDHHHLKNPEAPKIDFIKIKVPSYNVPLGALIPKNTSNFVVAEKSIAVSNIVAGATRLQPVVLGVGQAAGALAAVSILENKALNAIDIRQVQLILLKANAYLMPYIDVKTTDPFFMAVQKIGATGILKGEGNPYKWANQTWFYPDHSISEYDLLQGLKSYYPVMSNYQASGADLTIQEFAKMLHEINPALSEIAIQQKYAVLSDNKVMKRKHIAILIDALLNPFELSIDWFGNLK